MSPTSVLHASCDIGLAGFLLGVFTLAVCFTSCGVPPLRCFALVFDAYVARLMETIFGTAYFLVVTVLICASKLRYEPGVCSRGMSHVLRAKVSLDDSNAVAIGTVYRKKQLSI